MRVKRIAASVGATFDQFVNKMENHEAVANCVIEEIRHSAAKVRTEVNRVDHRYKALAGERQKFEDEKALWLRRAKQSVVKAGGDQRAIECIQQSKRIEKRLVSTVRQMQQTQELQESLRKNLHDIELRLEDLESRRAMLASREARAYLLKNHVCGSSFESEHPFERWEQEVVSNEYFEQVANIGQRDAGVDSQLARAFESEEEKVALQLELDALKKDMEKGD